MTLYAVTAQVVSKDSNGFTCSRQVPTFYLNAQVQGIVDAKHAEKIALEVINSTENPALSVHVCVATVYM